MFTGLIQTKAKVVSVEQNKEERRFILEAKDVKGFILGESVAVNGVCLSVEELINNNTFKVYASKETISKTNLGLLKIHQEVNIERALQVGDRLGGHLVTGHVDCLSTVEGISREGESLRYKLKFPDEFSCYVVEKGSVCLDGISLTINKCGKDFLEVNIIPITYEETNISSWVKGTLVNTEFDIIGKYVVRMIHVWKESLGEKEKINKKISFEFLKEHGFI